MALSAELNKKIIDFLTSIPNMHDNNVQRVLILRAALDSELQCQINFSGTSLQFFQLLVSTLQDYGTLEDGRDALEAILEAAKDSVGQDKKRYCDKLIQEIHSDTPSRKAFDLLIIDNEDTWRYIPLAVFEDVYVCDVAKTYEIAMEKIRNNTYKIVCTNWDIGSGTIQYSGKGQKLLNFLRTKHPDLSVVLITGDIRLLTGDVVENLQNIRNNYANIKKILFKGQTKEFVDALEQTIAQLMRNEIPNLFSQDELTFKKQKGDIMIIELLTKEAITAGVKFLADQFGKLTDRKNKELLEKVQAETTTLEKAAKTITTDQEAIAIRNDMQAIVAKLPEELQINTLPTFVAWVEKKVNTDFSDLIGVGDWVVQILQEKRVQEPNPQRKKELLDMAAYLKGDIEELRKTLTMNNDPANVQKNLYGRILAALDFLR